MQNNVTELTQRLLRSLDSNYNVIDIPEVVDIISLLEKVAITKELLETTRLGKHINELRRKTTNVELSRRAKELLKKWRSMVLPEANGQIKTSPPLQEGLKGSPNKGSPPLQEGHSLKPRASPVPQTKVSPPLIAQNLVSPALPGRLVSPAPVQSRTLSPGLYNQRLLSPNDTAPASHQKMVSPRKMVSPGLQTQRVSPKLAQQAQGQRSGISPPLTAGGQQQQQDVNLNQVVQVVKSKKRPAKDGAEGGNAKRARINGGMTDLDVSDSNSSFKDVILPTTGGVKPGGDLTKRDMIVINSDSNSSYSERPGGGGGGGDLLPGEIPKRRGRKKGSKNHKNLIDEAETSFTNKLAVSASRGNSKVKTTQELLASIQNKNSPGTMMVGGNLVLKSKEDLEEKAAKLTERVSIIDQKLNANARNKNSQKNKFTLSASRPNERVIESGSVINDKNLLRRIRERQRRQEEEDEIVVVDDIEPESETKSESQETESVGGGAAVFEEGTGARSLGEKEALALLPPIDKSVLLDEDDVQEPHCTCYLKENKPDFSIDEEEVEQPPPFEIIEDPGCLSKSYLEEKYRVRDLSEEKLRRLQEASLPNVNGNWSLGTPRPEGYIEGGLYVNVVPNIYERLDKDVKSFSAESRKKYSVSEGEGDGCSSDIVIIKKEVIGNSDESAVKKETLEMEEGGEQTTSDIRTEDKEVFREWYECVDRPSYNGDVLRILPYCVVD